MIGDWKPPLGSRIGKSRDIKTDLKVLKLVETEKSSRLLFKKI